MQRYLRELRPTLTLAVPIVVGQVSQMLMGVTDSVMIGHAGTVPLAASAFGGNIFGLFYIAGIGLMLPASIFVSRARGAQQPAECAEYLRHGIALAVLFGVVETLAMGLISLRLGWFHQSPEVVAAVNPFFLLMAASVTSVFIYLVLRQFTEAMGRPWVPMLIMLGGVGLNAALNWVFIYGHLGAPALGLTGAGISTLCSRSLGALVLFTWLRRSPAMRAVWPAGWWGRYSRARFAEMLRLGVPAAGMLVFEGSAFLFSSIMVGWLGTGPLAAHQIAISCVALTFMFPLGLSMAAGMQVSRAVGAGERARLRPIAFSALGLGLGLMLTFALVFWFGGGVIATWFVHDPAVIELAASLLAVAALFQLFDGAQVIGSSVLRAITDVKVPAFITFVAYWVVALPLGYFFGVRGGHGAVGVWSGLAAGLAFAAIFLALRFGHKTRPAAG